MFDFEFDFDFDFDLEHFQADTQALAPSAMPASKKGFNIKRILLNLAVISFLIGFIFLYTGLFGAKNAVSAISIATAMLMFINVDMGIKTSHAPIVIIVMFLFTGISSHFGTWNPFLGIAVNFISIFLIVTFSCQAITSKVYLPFVVCYIFSQSNAVYEMDLVKRMIGLLAGGILVSAVYVFFHRKTKHRRGILSLLKEVRPTSLRTRFALRLAFSLTLGMFLGDIFALRRTAWICMTINSLVLPFLHETRKRFPFRLLAQLPAAAIVYLFFVLIMPKEWYIVGLFFTSFLYMFATNYFIQQIFGSPGRHSDAFCAGGAGSGHRGRHQCHRRVHQPRHDNEKGLGTHADQPRRPNSVQLPETSFGRRPPQKLPLPPRHPENINVSCLSLSGGAFFCAKKPAFICRYIYCFRYAL